MCFCESLHFFRKSSRVFCSFCEFFCEARNFFNERFTLIAKVCWTFCNRCNFSFNRRNSVCNRFNSFCDCEDRNVNRECFTKNCKINRTRFRDKRELFVFKCDRINNVYFMYFVNKRIWRSWKLNHLIYECKTKKINDVEYDDDNAIECLNCIHSYKIIKSLRRVAKDAIKIIMWRLIAKRTFSLDSKVDLAVYSARATTNVLRFSLRITSYREQHLQIYQVLFHQTIWKWRCQRFFLKTSDFDFRYNLNKKHHVFSVLYRLETLQSKKILAVCLMTADHTCRFTFTTRMIRVSIY